MTHRKTQPTATGRDRLGFVSGSVLGWGILLAALRPRASHIYTGATLRFSFDFQDIYIGPRISPEPVVFYILNVLVALGVSVVTLAVCHLIAHGLLLASDTERREPRKLLSAFADASFHGALRVTWYVFFYLLALVPVYPAIVLQHWLADHWSIGKGLSFALLIICVSVPLSLIALRFRNRLKSMKPRDFLGPVALLLFVYGCYVAVAETAYTVSLSTGQTLYSKTANPYVEALIRLGGATSAPTDASVEVRNQGGQLLMSPAIRRVEGSLYHTYFSTESLPPGDYQIRLRYARASLTDTFPYWRDALIDTVFVSLAP